MIEVERKPALLDNVTQIGNAPLFVIIEVFEMLGLESEEMKQWHVEIKKEVMAYRASKKTQ